ncbi:MAG: outer membrane beta-barrel protein [Candidatus Eisenbacteria sp.]|nr:outer membrane beta-barrel protein [Candidatus Eisenbacteria bacterium]
MSRPANAGRAVRGRVTRPVHALLVAFAAILIGSLPLAEPSAAGTEGAWAQDRGFSLGLQFQTNVIGAEDPSEEVDLNDIWLDETGGGCTLYLGYTFVPSFCLRLTLGSARHETTRDAVEAFYNTVALEAHWRFLPQERARPYVYGALGGAVFNLDTERYDSETSGGMAGLGIGLLYNVTHRLVIDFNTRLDLINWDAVNVTYQLPGGGEVGIKDPIDDEGSAWRFQLGLAWEF